MNNLEIFQNKESLTIKSTELVDIINQFRILESEARISKDKNAKPKAMLLHKSFKTKIETELETLISLGLEGEQNILPSYYFDEQNKKQPCYELNRDGMLQMLNSESTLVRYKTIEYINQLEQSLVSQPIIKTSKFDNVEQAKAEMELLGVTSDILKLNDSSKLKIAHKIYKNNDVSTTYLPEYTTSKRTLLSATELLKRHNIEISAQAFNKLLINNGIMEEKERPSKSKGVKKFKSIKNIYYGENEINTHSSSQETQPLLYEDKFEELLKLVGLL